MAKEIGESSNMDTKPSEEFFERADNVSPYTEKVSTLSENEAESPDFFCNPEAEEDEEPVGESEKKNIDKLGKIATESYCTKIFSTVR